MSCGLTQAHVSGLVQSVSFVEVLLTAGIIDIGEDELRYTPLHAEPKMKALLGVQRKDQKREK